jgi:hypothetical protein
LPAKPKSTIQTSPGSVLGIFILQGVQHAEAFVRPVPALLEDLGLVIQGERSFSDLTAFSLREPGQFREDVCVTHDGTLRLGGRFRKSLASMANSTWWPWSNSCMQLREN